MVSRVVRKYRGKIKERIYEAKINSFLCVSVNEYVLLEKLMRRRLYKIPKNELLVNPFPNNL